MAKKQDFKFERIDIDGDNNSESNINLTSEESSPPIKVGFYVEGELRDKFQDYCFWEASTQQEVCLMALEEFFKNKKTQPRPEKIKNRQIGRKKKNK